MKQFLLMAIMLLTFGAVSAQIAEVKQDGRIAKIYNDQGRYTNNYISLCSNCYIKNVSGTAILVKDGNITKYYDFNGRYTNKYTSD